jgi:hypothetical protein
MAGPEYFDQHTGGAEYFDAAPGHGEEFAHEPYANEPFDDGHKGEYFSGPDGHEEFSGPDGHEEYSADGHEEFSGSDGHEEFSDHNEEWENPHEEFNRRKGKGKRRSLGQYLRMLVRYLIEAAVLVAVLYLLTPAESRGSLRDLAMMAVTFAAILILLDMFGGMGLAARLGAGLGVGFRMAGVASVL